ncbi:hypothetical protein HY345_02535 [Candidatus Microgenomates bacterium]|nr:hypothetical protein [Candidatus Microgenomates bacterium]
MSCKPYMTYNKFVQKIKKVVLIILFLALLCFPPITIIGSQDWKSFVSSFSDVDSLIYLLLRFFALYGIIFLFIQVLLGSFVLNFRQIFGPKILQFHIIQGILTYLIITLHPTMFFVFNFNTQGWEKALAMILPSFTNRLDFYLNFGKLAIVLLNISVFAGLLRKVPALIPHWRKLHRLNYVVFALIIYHSWNIGQDTRLVPFVYLYPVFLTGLVAAIINKIKKYLPVSNSLEI